MSGIGSFGRKSLKRLRRGQGMVEFVIIAPVLLIILSGLMEFGFLLNEYLDLLDGAREAARFASDDNPFTGAYADDLDFYIDAGILAEQTSNPVALCDEGPSVLGVCPDDPDDIVRGDVVISVFGVADTSGGVVIRRFPTGSGEWSKYGKETSQFATSDLSALIDPAAPNTGVVVVEVFYDYPQKFKLPWITAFVPDPIKVRTLTIMPLVAAEPTPTPLP